MQEFLISAYFNDGLFWGALGFLFLVPFYSLGSKIHIGVSVFIIALVMLALHTYVGYTEAEYKLLGEPSHECLVSSMLHNPQVILNTDLKTGVKECH